MSRLDCRAIVQYVESGKSRFGDVYWIVTDLLVGESLELVLSNGQIGESEAIQVYGRAAKDLDEVFSYAKSIQCNVAPGHHLYCMQ